MVRLWVDAFSICSDTHDKNTYICLHRGSQGESRSVSDTTG